MLLGQNKSLSLSDIKLGQKEQFNVWISSDDIDRYAEISRDFSAIHTNKAKAVEAGFKDRVVHGSLIASYFSSIVGVHLPGDTALLIQSENKFHCPVYANTNLLIEGRVNAIHESLECIEIAMKATDEIGQRVASGSWLVRVRQS